MDAARFADARAALQRLIAADVPDLAGVGDLREDGIPHDWVPDIGEMDAAQRQTLVDDIGTPAHPWLATLAQHLGA